MARRYDKWLAEKKYKAKLNFLTKVHKATDPIAEAYNRALNECDGRTLGFEFQGYKNEIGCSKLKIYGIGYMLPAMESNNSIGHQLLNG